MTSKETMTRLLAAAVQQVRHYGPQHPAATESVRRFAAAVADELRQAAAVRFEASGEWLMVQGTALPAADPFGQQLHKHLADRRAARLVIATGVSPAALREFVRLLALEPEELIAEGGLSEALRRGGVEGIEVEGPEAAPLPVETDEYAAAITAAGATFAAVEGGAPVDVGRVQLVVETLHGAPAAALWPQVLLRGHDELDPAHGVNVAYLAMQTAHALGLPASQQIDLGVAAFLHDIGLARLPYDDRLQERTPVARHDAVRHPAEGALLLRHLGGRESLPMLAAAEHHRTFVHGGEELPPQIRLVALADYLDAMTCARMGGLRPATVGGLLSTLLAGEGPPFDRLHVRLMAGAVAAAAR